MQLSLEPADAINLVPTMPSDRKFNEKSVIQGYFNQKIIIFAVEIEKDLWNNASKYSLTYSAYL